MDKRNVYMMVRYIPRNIFSAILICSAVICGASLSYGEVRVDSEVNAERFLVGDKISVDVSVPGAENAEVIFPETPPYVDEDIPFVEGKDLAVKDQKPGIKGRTYTFDADKKGTYAIPPIEVKYRKTPDDEWQVLSSYQIPIEVESVLTGEEKDICDIKGLEKLPVSYFSMFLMLIAGAVIIACIWWICLKKGAGVMGKKDTRIRPAHEIAYDELEELQKMDLPAKGQVKEYYVLLSDIARRYLENRFSYRVPEMTTEEFLYHLKQVSEMPREHKGLLKDFLTQCDMVKFAKYGPTPLEILDSFKLAEKIVDATKLVQEDAEEDEK